MKFIIDEILFINKKLPNFFVFGSFLLGEKMEKF